MKKLIGAVIAAGAVFVAVGTAAILEAVVSPV
jgi:hypothetical protein